MKKIAILGSTGSIGTQTLEVVDAYPNEFKVVALSAGENISLLDRQIRKYHPAIVSVKSKKEEKILSDLLADMVGGGDDLPQIYYGMDGLIKVSEYEESDLLVTAIVGMIGIRPTIAAIAKGKDIALANKETLVTAGHLIMPMIKEKGVHIYSVDSEHSAISQCLKGEEPDQVEKILLTASGGPFLGKTKEELACVKAADALKHPTWAMGKKITIDCATLINKGLEIIEASFLFNVPEDRIKVVVQPQSLIHSMVQFRDGSIMAQLGRPDVRIPIQYALFGNRHRFLDQRRIDFEDLGSLRFSTPDTGTFRGITLAREAIREGGLMPTILNAANERAVDLFLEGRISFLEIYDLIDSCMQSIPNIASPNVEQILQGEAAVYEMIDSKISRRDA